MFIRVLLVIVLSVHYWVGYSQILDDTTKLVYGPETTSYYYEHNIKYNIDGQYTMDTTLSNVHRYNASDRSDWTYQNLGTIGTAIHPTFYRFPTIVGRTPGFTGNDPYVRGIERTRYYDTKSPFLDLDIFFGGQTRSIASVEFARNIKPNWNTGFNIRRVVSDKQIGAQQLRGDRNVEEIYYDFTMSYTSNNNRYRILGYVSRFDHRVEETGGIRVFSDLRSELFRYRDANITLRNAVSKDFRLEYHAYHQYELTKYSQVYHSFRRSAQRNSFRDYTIEGDTTGFYANPLIDPDSTRDQSTFIYLENEVGLKGNLGPLFYNGFIKRRDINHYYRYSQPFEKTSESSIGFNARFDFSETIKLGGDGEFLQDGNFKGNAFIETPFLEGGYHVARYEPSNIQKNYLGNHDAWQNSFTSTFAFELYGNLKYSNKFMRLKPGISFTTVDNYIYFDQEAVPQQDGRPANISSLNVDLDIDLPKHFHLALRSKLTNVSGDASDIFRIPEIFTTGGMYYDNFLFNDYMQVRVGVDVYYRNAYFGNAFDPITQQFFLQDTFQLESYAVADAYITTKVNNMMIFLKYNHVNQSDSDGYFVTPFYPGIPRILDVGFQWRFFD